jgi:hypothetical protein
MATRKANPVENPEELTPGQHIFLQVGDQVQTPYGVGKVKDIALQLGVYEVDDKGKTKTELDPPRVTVTIEETGQDVVVCLCELGLPLSSYETIVKEEFERLWPPVDQATPEADEDALSVAELKSIRRQQVAFIKERVAQGKLPMKAAKQRVAALKRVRTKEQLATYRIAAFRQYKRYAYR